MIASIKLFTSLLLILISQTLTSALKENVSQKTTVKSLISPSNIITTIKNDGSNLDLESSLPSIRFIVIPPRLLDHLITIKVRDIKHLMGFSFFVATKKPLLTFFYFSTIFPCSLSPSQQKAIKYQ